jgi:hypothetical protein
MRKFLNEFVRFELTLMNTNFDNILDCDGQAYLFSNDLAKKLYDQSKHENYFTFEDVYIGILASKLNSIYDSNFHNYYTTFSNSNSATNYFDNYFIIYVNGFEDFILLWNIIQTKILKVII